MEDFGDYIYLILLIVFSVVGLLKKKKQAVEIPQTSTEAEEDYDDSEVVIFPPIDSKDESNFPNQEKPAPVVNWPVFSTPVSKPEKTVFDGITESYETASDYSKIKPITQVKPAKTEVKKQKNIFDDFEESDSGEFSIVTSEDARRAIIFSEIINRKY